MSNRLPFRYVEPTFFAGLLDDPLLLVHVRPLGEALLFDCGQLHHLAKRVLKSISAIFISHAHMDHFMGMDTFIRHNHVSPRTVDIFGPPGIAEKMASKLASYDWNLAQPFWCTFRVHEISPVEVTTSVFRGAKRYHCQLEGKRPRLDLVIYQNLWLRVEAELCDHGIPSLAFRLTERQSFAVDERKIEAVGLVKGDWLRLLKKHFHRQVPVEKPLTVLKLEQGEVSGQLVTDLDALYQAIRKDQSAASIGYVTDVGFSAQNISRLQELLAGITLLVCECSFRAEEQEKARASSHFCTKDLNHLLDRLRPRFILPMHLSKSYLQCSQAVYEQLRLPAGVTLLKIPDRLTPRPFLSCEIPKPHWST